MITDVQAYSDKHLATLLPWPKQLDNKYTRGKLVLAAGCAKYPGAACLAATAASRAGAGYVQVCCADEAVLTVRAWQPSLVVVPWSQGVPLGGTTADSKPVAYAVGPGFDAREERCLEIARAMMQSAADSALPLLVDGGALGSIADAQAIGMLKACASAGVPVVLTPHGGEAARLATAAGIPSFEGQPEGMRDQEDLARRLSEVLSAVVVLKGPDTVVSYGGAAVEVTEGTAALAKAGTGDVLAGMVAGLLAQGMNAVDASVLGVTLHARAGRIAADRLTDICVLPEDVLDAIPEAVRATAQAQ